MSEFWFEVSEETDVVGQDGKQVIGKVRPGQRYKAVAMNDHWATVPGPNDTWGYVPEGVVQRVDDTPLPPPAPTAASTAVDRDTTQPLPRVAAPKAGQPPIMKRPITAIGGVLLGIAGAGIDFLTDTSPWDIPISFLIKPNDFSADGIGVGLLLIVGAALVLVGVATTRAQPGLVGLGAIVGLAAIGLLIQAFIRLDAFGEFFSSLGIGAYVATAGGLLALYGAGKR